MKNTSGAGCIEVDGKYHKILEQRYIDVDGEYYKIIKTEDFYLGYGIGPKGMLIEVPPEGLLVEGRRIPERLFLNEIEAKKKNLKKNEAAISSFRPIAPVCH